MNLIFSWQVIYHRPSTDLDWIGLSEFVIKIETRIKLLECFQEIQGHSVVSIQRCYWIS